MEAPSNRQSRMAIDSILNPSGSVDSHPTDCRLYQTYYPTSPYRQQPSYYADKGLKQQPYSNYPRPSSSHHHHHNPDYSLPSFSFSSHGSSSLLPPSTESSPSPFSRDRYDSISSTSTAPTSASRASISSSATSISTTDAFNKSGATTAASTAPSTTSSTSINTGAGAGAGTSAADRRRPARPKYEEEEMYFIWYHRVDLGLEWKEVRESFNRQFPSRPRSGFQGIQCKFYRFIRDKKCPTLREQRRMRDGEFLHEGAGSGSGSGSVSGISGNSPTPEVGGKDAAGPKYGVVEWMGAWYPWMRESRLEVARKRLST